MARIASHLVEGTPVTVDREQSPAEGTLVRIMETRAEADVRLANGEVIRVAAVAVHPRPEPDGPWWRPRSAGARIALVTAIFTVIGSLATVAAVVGPSLWRSTRTPHSGSRATGASSGAQEGRTIAALAGRANRRLPLRETPVPGSRRGTLGFGDAMGGRPTYPYRNGLPKAPATPTFDSIPNLPGNGDERKFLRVEASATKDARQVALPSSRAVIALSGDVVYVGVLVDNNAGAAPGCKLSGATVARDARMILKIWNSRDNRLHILRAWLMASNLSPHWVTDAAAVITRMPTTLEPDPSLSREYAKSSHTYRNAPLIDAQRALDPFGMQIGDGRVGSCWDDRHYLTLALRQT
jgi:hypothetical protein